MDENLKEKYFAIHYSETEDDATYLLNKLKELFKENKYVTVYDFNNLIGMSNNSPLNKDYGWTDLGTACVSKSRFGYGLYLPRVKKIGGY